MRKFSKKQTAATAALTVVLLGGGTAAYAYWTTTGTGTGAATTSEGAPLLTVEQTTTVTNMFPGDEPQSLVVQVTNDAENSAYVQFVKGIATVNQASGATGACDPTDYSYNGDPLPPSGAFTMTWTATDMAAGASLSTAGDTLKFNNKASNQDGCKDATVTFAYTAS